MFGFVAGLAGVTLAAPALLAVGLIAGGKGLQAEKERRLVARQAQAKAAARKFVDDVTLEVGKDSRDEVRRAQTRAPRPLHRPRRRVAAVCGRDAEGRAGRHRWRREQPRPTPPADRRRARANRLARRPGEPHADRDCGCPVMTDVRAPVAPLAARVGALVDRACTVYEAHPAHEAGAGRAPGAPARAAARRTRRDG